MLRRSSAYSYLTDPNSHALDKEKNAKYAAESNMVLLRTTNNLNRFTQDDNIYHSRQKNVRQSVGPVAKNETVLSLGQPAKSTIALSHIRSMTNNIPPPRPPTPQLTILPKTRGSMSYQVQHRRSMVRSSLTDISIVSQKEVPRVANEVKPGRRISSLFVNNPSTQNGRNAPLLPRKTSSNFIAKKSGVKNSDSDDDKTSDAVYSGDYVADNEDATVDDISSYASDDCWTDLENQTGHGGLRRDAQTQTLHTAVAWYLTGHKFPFHKMQKRTETCQVQTMTLYARRSHSDTSLRRSKIMERPSTSPPKLFSQSTKISKLISTMECCARPSTSPAQFFSTTRAKTTEFFKSKEITESCTKPTTSLNPLGIKSTELSKGGSKIFHSTSTMEHEQQLTKNEIRVPEAIKAILEPLERTNGSVPGCTMTRGMALTFAASFLLFLALLWIGISVSLATHRIVTQYLYPPPPETNPISLFLRSFLKYVHLFAHWVWYIVYY